MGGNKKRRINNLIRMEPVQWWDFNLTFVLSVVFLASCDASDSALALISVFVLDMQREKKKKERERERGR